MNKNKNNNEVPGTFCLLYNFRTYVFEKLVGTFVTQKILFSTNCYQLHT